MYFGLFSFTDLMLLVPAMLFALYAQFKIKNTYDKFSKIPSENGITGARIASMVLQNNNIHDVKIEETEGRLSDHYDPISKTLRQLPCQC